MPEFYMIHARKIIKIPEFLIFARNLPEKNNKIPEFYMIFAENARILHNNCPKNIFPNFRGEGGTCSPYAPLRPSPTPMVTLV